MNAVGCEPVCGTCAACAPLAWVLQQLTARTPAARLLKGAVELQHRPLKEPKRSRYDAMRTVLDKPSRDEITMRAMRARGVEPYSDGVGPTGLDPRLWAPKAPEAIDALARLLRAGLCSREETLRVLGVPS